MNLIFRFYFDTMNIDILLTRADFLGWIPRSHTDKKADTIHPHSKDLAQRFFEAKAIFKKK